MPKYCQMIIDTPEFQRLRFIKQLGCTSYVFPSAVHTRFEHSIGVSHLAGKLARVLQDNERTNRGSNQDSSLTPIQDNEVACVEIAGLCHDLGHGPFSHSFEDIVPLGEDGKKWKHETMSVILFKYIIEHNNLKTKLTEYNIYEEHISFICELIIGGPLEGRTKLSRENKFYLYQIVSNSTNGVDVDRWDYFARDTHYLGMKSAFDFNRIMPFVKVYGVQRGDETRQELCFRDKVASDLNHMFLTRRRLHYTSYQHRVSKIITIMLKDAFLAAARHLKFTGKDGRDYSLLESVQDPTAFCQVNDTIVNEIMRSKAQDPGMVKAREIIDRIHKRQLYQCIGECQHANEVVQLKTVDGDEIKKRIVDAEGELSSLGSSSREIWQGDNIEVEVSVFDYGNGDKNPLLDIPFYKKSSQGTFSAQLLPENELPADLPQRLEDITIRIYTKVPGLNKTSLDVARARCKNKLEELRGRRQSIPMTPTTQMIKSRGGISPLVSSPPTQAVVPRRSSGAEGSGMDDGDYNEGYFQDRSVEGARSLRSNSPDDRAARPSRDQHSPEPEAKLTLDFKRRLSFDDE